MFGTADELQVRTQIFWEVSKSFNAQSKHDLSTATAITICSESLDHIAPTRPLARRFANLERQIIVGRSRKKKPQPTNNVRQLHKSGTNV